jgi:hypothetical protein
LLNLAGTSLYNLNIRSRRIFNKNEWNGMFWNTPTAYQLFSAHVNHSKLALINKLGQAGFNQDVHGNVLILPRDNGERMFPEYLTQELVRNNKTITPLTGRCMCIRCGGRKNINNYYADSIKVNDIANRIEQKEIEGDDVLDNNDDAVY